MSFPILLDHDPEAVIGQYDDGVIEFKPRTVTQSMIGGLGLRILEMEEVDGVTYILSAEVIELSLERASSQRDVSDRRVTDV